MNAGSKITMKKPRGYAIIGDRILPGLRRMQVLLSL